MAHFKEVLTIKLLLIVGANSNNGGSAVAGVCSCNLTESLEQTHTIVGANSNNGGSAVAGVCSCNFTPFNVCTLYAWSLSLSKGNKVTSPYSPADPLAQRRGIIKGLRLPFDKLRDHR